MNGHARITPALTLRPLSPHLAALVAAAARRIERAETPLGAALIAAGAGCLPEPPTGRALLPMLAEPVAGRPAARRPVPPPAACARLLDRAV